MSDVFSTQSNKNNHGITVFVSLNTQQHSTTESVDNDIDIDSLNNQYNTRFSEKLGFSQTINTFDAGDAFAATASTGVDGGLRYYEFDQTTDEYARFQDKLPNTYGSRPFDVVIGWSSAVAGAGDVVWAASVDNMATGVTVNSLNFGTAVSGTFSSSGQDLLNTSIINMTSESMESLGPSDNYVINISRSAADGSDTLAGDARLVSLEVRESDNISVPN